MTEREWHESNLAVQRQARDAEIARYREWRERTEKKLRAQRAALQSTAKAAAQKAPPPPATRGFGWSVLATPRIPHARLEESARGIWAFCWHHADWPGWRVKWGALDADLLTIGAAIGGAARSQHCAVSLFGRTVLGLAVMNEKIILLDEENQQGRPVRDIVKTIVHELCHVHVRSTVHGDQFQQALESAMAYYDGEPDAPALPRFTANASAPPPWVGARFRPGVGLVHPGIEYRG